MGDPLPPCTLDASTLGASVSFLSIPGVRIGISYKRGDPICSPDVEYAEKIASVKQALEQTQQNPETHVAFYQDEFVDDSRFGHSGTKHPEVPTNDTIRQDTTRLVFALERNNALYSESAELFLRTFQIALLGLRRFITEEQRK